MSRIILMICGLGLIGYFAYTSYGYRYMLDHVHKTADTQMIMGDKNAENTITLYIDYDSAASRRIYPILLGFLSADQRVNLLIRPVPGNSDTSSFAARLALAAKDKKRFLDLSSAILTSNVRLDEPYLQSLIRSLNMDYNKLKIAAFSPEINEEIEKLKRERALMNAKPLPVTYIDHVKLDGTNYSQRDLEQIVSDLRMGRR